MRSADGSGSAHDGRRAAPRRRETDPPIRRAGRRRRDLARRVRSGASRDHRTERRRENHAVQPHHGPPRGEPGPRRVRRPPDYRSATRRRGAARDLPLVPAHESLSEARGAREPPRGGSRDRTRQLQPARIRTVRRNAQFDRAGQVAEAVGLVERLATPAGASPTASSASSRSALRWPPSPGSCSSTSPPRACRRRRPSA